MQLDSDFEADLQAALLDDVERRARQKLAPQVQQRAHELLREYGQRHDYDVESLIAAGETEVIRRSDAVELRWGWPEPAIYFEFGTADHVVQAQGAEALSFVWDRDDNPPQWVREEFEREGDGWRVFLPEVEVDGLPEARYIRDALNYARRVIAG